MPRVVPRVAPLSLAVLSALVPWSARAGVEWLCGLSASGTQIVCVADAAPGPTAEAAPEPRTVVNGVAFPLQRERLYTVEMWSPPTDMAFAQLLARATMCYRTPDCRVTWTDPMQTARR